MSGTWCKFCRAENCGGMPIVKIEVMTQFGRVGFGVPLNRFPGWKEIADELGTVPLSVNLIGSLLHVDQRFELIKGGKDELLPIQRGLFL